MQAILANAAAGISGALSRFEASARRTAADPLADPAGEIVERLNARTQLMANAQVIRTVQEMDRALLDMMDGRCRRRGCDLHV
jgi:hypothetical protein